MTKRNGRPPKRKLVPPRPAVTGWNGMTPEQLQAASFALSADPEDSTEEEKAQLQRFIDLGGNVWAL